MKKNNNAGSEKDLFFLLPAPEFISRNYLTENLYIVVDLRVSPGLIIVEGKSG